MSSSSRPLAALVSFVLATVLGVLALAPDCASACSCAIVGSQKERVEQAISDSKAVFSGEAVDFEKGAVATFGPTETVSFRVSKVWKGPEQETLEVGTQVFGASCGYPFKEGQEYLVYAYEGKRGLTVDLCTETKELSKAGADLALLGNSSEKPKDAGEEALSDTSGGFSVGAMVGMAGLVVAASLFVVARLVRTG
jgi:hypothetical protein